MDKTYVATTHIKHGNDDGELVEFFDGDVVEGLPGDVMVSLYHDGSIVEEGSSDDPNLLPAAVVHNQTPRVVEEVLKAQVKEAQAPGGGAVVSLTHPDNDPADDPQALLDGHKGRLGKNEDDDEVEPELSALDSGKTPPPAPVGLSPTKATKAQATKAQPSGDGSAKAKPNGSGD
jgi:hypothetical protein